MQALEQAFYQRSAEVVAEELLGMQLVHLVDGVARIGRIVETEAYLGPHDLACHSSRGRTARTEVMFGPAGRAYVYLIYGMHHCFNVVTGHGEGAAVLIRALEPLSPELGRCSGPGLLCQAMAISRQHNGRTLDAGELFLAMPERRERFAIARRPRIGVHYAGPWARRLLRYTIRNSPWLSRP